MLKAGLNEVDGVPVEVVLKRIRRINIRIGSDGMVRISVPKWWTALRAAEDFLTRKWSWVLKVRAKAFAAPAPALVPPSAPEIAALRALLGLFHAQWTERLGEREVTWKLRHMKSVWGSCHWRTRRITYSTELAHAPRELVEYVVVHELTHLVVPNHGPAFYVRMDERLPGWKTLRRRLNRREFDMPDPSYSA